MHGPRRWQQPGQVVGLAGELLAGGGDLGVPALRLERRDQAAQSRAQVGGGERFVIGETHEVAEQLAEAAQPAGWPARPRRVP